MASETKTTGTPPQDGTDALDQSGTGGTPEADGRDAESKELEDLKALMLAQKQTIEDLKRQTAELNERQQQPPVAEGTEVQNMTEQIAEWEAKAKKLAQDGDPASALSLMNRADILRIERNNYLTRQYDSLPTDRRDKVLKHYNSNTHRLGDLAAADAELRAPDLEKENQELKERLAKLERPPDPDVVNAPPTHTREFTARETKKRWTEAAWDQERERIRSTQGEIAALKFDATAPNQWG